MLLHLLILVIVLGAVYLVVDKFVSISREVKYEVKYEVTLVDEDEEDGAW